MTTPFQPRPPSPELGLDLLRTMLLIREFDTVAEQLARSKSIPGHAHSYVGQEAIAAGVCAALRPDDFVASTHRGHGHLLARGSDPGPMFAELYGYESGSNRGKGGSLHIADIDVGMLGAVSLVGGGVPLAVGAALNAWVHRTDQVAVAFFGDGAANEGILHEALNVAAVDRLPVVFVCENNLYAVLDRTAETTAPVDLARRADGFGIPGLVVDGNDVWAVLEAATAAVARARAGGGPTFVEARTYRLSPHNSNFPEDRPAEEIAAWKAKDPIQRLRAQLEALDPAIAGQIRRIEHEVSARIEAALAFARAGRRPPVEQAAEDLFAPAYVPEVAPDFGSTVEMTLAEAVNEALHEELARDDRVFLFGIRHGVRTGVYTGLPEEFGPRRIAAAAVSEAIVVGAGNGAALAGGRPVLEVDYVDFSTLAMDQIVNIMAKHRYLCGGRVKLPLVLRTQFGYGSSIGATHSQSLEAFFYHVPGLKLVMPSTPADAKGLLKSAIRDDNPVIFLEPRNLYRVKGPVPTNDYAIPLGVAAVRREGQDVTVVAFGPAVPLALESAENLANEGISVEVIDPRTLVPLDVETILASVRKTHRLVVFQQASVQGGVGSDICRIANARAWADLWAPVLVAGSEHIPVPYSPPLEQAVLFSPDRLVDAIRTVMSHTRLSAGG